MQPEPFAVVGRVVKTHGLKGEVSVVSATGASLSVLIGLDAWFTPPPRGVRSARISDVRPGPKGELVTFEGIGSIDAARAVCGANVLIRSDDVPAEWHAADLEDDSVEGYSVVDDVHGPLGEIVETIITGANDVWVVEGPLGEVLIPVIEQVVLDIDDDARRVSVHLLPGLLPGEDDE